MQQRDAILKVEYLMWALDQHQMSKMPSDLKLSQDKLDRLKSKLEEVIQILKDTES